MVREWSCGGLRRSLLFESRDAPAFLKWGSPVLGGSVVREVVVVEAGSASVYVRSPVCSPAHSSFSASNFFWEGSCSGFAVYISPSRQTKVSGVPTSQL